MSQISEKLDAILDQLSNFGERLTEVEKKLQKKTIKKTKSEKNVSKVHIFPFEDDDEYVRMALIEDGQSEKEFYPVVEFLKMDFLQLANLIVQSQTLSTQWQTYDTTDLTAKMENNQMVLVGST